MKMMMMICRTYTDDFKVFGLYSSFPAAPKIRRWPKLTIPLHRTGNLNHLSLWHHPLSSKNVLSISSSILSTTRCGELYYCHNGEIQGKVFCIAVNLFDGERIQSPQSIALIALLNWAQNIYLNQHMGVHQYISLESSTVHSTPVQFAQIFLRIFHQPETCRNWCNCTSIRHICFLVRHWALI